MGGAWAAALAPLLAFSSGVLHFPSCPAASLPPRHRGETVGAPFGAAAEWERPSPAAELFQTLEQLQGKRAFRSFQGLNGAADDL